VGGGDIQYTICDPHCGPTAIANWQFGAKTLEDHNAIGAFTSSSLVGGPPLGWWTPTSTSSPFGSRFVREAAILEAPAAGNGVGDGV